MRRLIGSITAAGALAAANAASAQASAAPGLGMEAEAAAGAMGHHQRTYTFLQSELDHAPADEQTTWDVQGWVGGDRNKLWLKSEGEFHGGEAENAELQLLYSRNIGVFFDAQVGVRHDFEPQSTTYLAAGVQGLAPYLLETEATAFLSEDGHASLRLEQSFDVLLTQRLILEPYAEAELQAGDVPERRLGRGLSEAEAGLQLRYEISRKFAPYADLAYERTFGETAELRRAAGEDEDRWTLRIGLRSWL